MRSASAPGWRRSPPSRPLIDALVAEAQWSFEQHERLFEALAAEVG